jgi:hypothetical protein
MRKQVTSSINRLLSKSIKKQLMKIAKKHEKGVTRKKKKKKKKSRTFMKHNVSNKGREGIDFKTFHIDLTKPSSCMPKRKCKSHRMNIPKRRNGCKSHRMNIPKRRNGCKSHRMSIPKRRNGCKSNGRKSNKGKIMMKHMKIPKKCNESIVHFLNL